VTVTSSTSDVEVKKAAMAVNESIYSSSWEIRKDEDGVSSCESGERL